ncbi:MAG TPA: YibE/F family protein, partial [Acidimicrobiales bacterium]|nr:YibE/F family protein [Acidimicrobiales bacterium]
MALGHDHGHERPSMAALTSGLTRRVLTGVIAAVLLATLVGLVLLWPDGDRDITAPELGFTGELVDAEVTLADVVPCAGTTEVDGILCTEVSFHVSNGPTEGDAAAFQVPITDASVSFEEGDGIVLIYEAANEPQFQYRFSDFQRRTPLTVLWILFVGAVVALGRWQGVRALVGLLVTGVVMVGFLFPSILDGHDPTAVALVSASVIGVVALYLTHGVSERTTVALLGTFGALALTAVLAAVFSAAAHFTGFGTEDAFYLQVAASSVDIKGLVLAGIIIGSLGVLDDVTVTQVSAVWQLRMANPSYRVRELYGAAVRIGRDHIASTVNTLVLAYAGASLPLLLVYTQAGRRLSDVATGELVAVEIVRTLVGSIGLVAAVPITTALAAIVAVRGGDGG